MSSPPTGLASPFPFPIYPFPLHNPTSTPAHFNRQPAHPSPLPPAPSSPAPSQLPSPIPLTTRQRPRRQPPWQRPERPGKGNVPQRCALEGECAEKKRHSGAISYNKHWGDWLQSAARTWGDMTKCLHRAAPGIESGTSRTLSENHTTRPSSQLLSLKIFMLTGLATASSVF